MKEKDLPVARKRELFAAAFGPRLLDDGFFPVKRAFETGSFYCRFQPGLGFVRVAFEPLSQGMGWRVDAALCPYLMGYEAGHWARPVAVGLTRRTKLFDGKEPFTLQPFERQLEMQYADFFDNLYGPLLAIRDAEQLYAAAHTVYGDEEEVNERTDGIDDTLRHSLGWETRLLLSAATGREAQARAALSELLRADKALLFSKNVRDELPPFPVSDPEVQAWIDARREERRQPVRVRFDRYSRLQTRLEAEGSTALEEFVRANVERSRSACRAEFGKRFTDG